MDKFLSALKWPFKTLSNDISQQVAEKAAIGAKAALGEAPILEALLAGQEVTLQIKLQFKAQ